MHAIDTRAGMPARFKLATAAQYADALVAYLKQVAGVKQVVVAGSYRRAEETVGDLDILVTALSDSPVIGRFTTYSEVAEVLAKGGTRASVRLASRLQVDLRVVAEESYGAAYITSPAARRITLPFANSANSTASRSTSMAFSKMTGASATAKNLSSRL